MDEKTGNYWKILETTLEWIRYSDAKATAILTIYGIVITVVFSNLQNILSFLSGSAWIAVLAVLPLLSSLIAIFFGFRCISPRMERSSYRSIMFFGSIMKHFPDEEAFREATHKVLDTRVGLDDDLAHQIYINSRIAHKKFRDVSLSIRFFVISMVMALVLLMGVTLKMGS